MFGVVPLAHWGPSGAQFAVISESGRAPELKRAARPFGAHHGFGWFLTVVVSVGCVWCLKAQRGWWSGRVQSVCGLQTHDIEGVRGVRTGSLGYAN